MFQIVSKWFKKLGEARLSGLFLYLKGLIWYDLIWRNESYFHPIIYFDTTDERVRKSDIASTIILKNTQAISAKTILANGSVYESMVREPDFIVSREKLQLVIKSPLKKLMVLLKTPLEKFALSRMIEITIRQGGKNHAEKED